MTDDAPDISPLRGGEVASASRLLTAALRDDPGWTYVVPERRRRLAALNTITRVAVRDALVFGSVLAARDGDRLDGVAVWLPPGRYPMSRRRKMRTVPAMTALALRAPGDIRDLSRFGASIDAAFPVEPVWYLQVLGVHPERQRLGIGRRLLRPVLTEAERTGVVCYLETAQPDNVAYYQRLGFSLVVPPAPLYPSGPSMARMTRPPGTLVPGCAGHRLYP
jgi:GNAT superfamily N-acetyltransferase